MTQFEWKQRTITAVPSSTKAQSTTRLKMSELFNLYKSSSSSRLNEVTKMKQPGPCTNANCSLNYKNQ